MKILELVVRDCGHSIDYLHIDTIKETGFNPLLRDLESTTGWFHLDLKNSMSGDGEKKFWVPCLLFLAATVYLTLRQTLPLGVGLSPDSAMFIRIAREILANGFQFFGSDLGVAHIPGYPLILAAAAFFTHTAPLTAAVIVNTVSLVLIVLMFMLDARRIGGISPWLSGLLITFSLPLMSVFSMAWSEPVFILFTYAIFRRAVLPEQGWRSALLLGLLTGFAFLIRYLGLALFPLVFLQLFLFSSPEAEARRRNALVFLGTASLVMGSFLLRNFLVSGTLFGVRAPSRLSLLDNLKSFNQTIFDWFVPDVPAGSIARWVLAAAILAFIWFTRKSIYARLRQTVNHMGIQPMFVLVFSALLIISATRTAFDGVSSRLLAPIYPALAVTILLFVAPGSQTPRGKRLALIARWLLVLVIIAQPLRIIIKDTHRRGREGAGGYNLPEWRDSHLLRHCLLEISLEGEVFFSNAPGALYILEGIAAHKPPGRTFYNSDKPTGVTPENLFEKYPALDGALLIWFDRLKRPYLFTPEELETICRVHVVEKCQDGTIYRLERLTRP